MTPLKETLEAVESGASQGSKPLKTDAGHLRADAVSLDVPVKIHGSRVTDVVLGVTPHTEPFEEQTSTMIVFPQGGVLRMSTVVSVGQAVVLTNLKSGKDAICRVAKVRACPNNQNYVEVEFTHRQPGYWGVHFSSDGPELAKKTAPAESEAILTPAPRVSVIRPAESTVVSSQMKAPGAPPENSVQQGLPESSFISIGSQEKVQPAASSTAGAKGGDPFAISNVDRSPSAGAKKSTVTNFPAPAAPAVSAFRSVAELRRDVQAASSAPTSGLSHGAQVPELPAEELDTLLPDSAEPATRPSFGNFASSVAGGAARSAPREMFGSQSEAEAMGTGEPAAGPRKNWMLIGACAAAALVIVMGGAFYFRSANSPAKGAASVSTSAAPDGSDASANSVSGQAQQANMVNAGRASSVPVTREVVVVHADPQPSKSSKAPVEAPSAPAEPAVASAPAEPSAPAKTRGSRPVSNLFGSLNAHPAAAIRSGSNQSIGAAPSLDLGVASGIDSNALAGPSPLVSAPAKPASDGPLDVGGNVMPPRLISSVPPTYPAIAIQTQVQGTVLIQAVVDKAGNVTSAKVISGPELLRESALDALRRWKYQPPTLNGQPISVRMSVSIQFRR